MNIKCTVLDFRQVTRREFVRFWERFYTDYSEEFYRENIGQPLT
jgi:hypothetical protein